MGKDSTHSLICGIPTYDMPYFLGVACRIQCGDRS